MLLPHLCKTLNAQDHQDLIFTYTYFGSRVCLVFLEDEEKLEIPEKWFVCFDGFFYVYFKKSQSSVVPCFDNRPFATCVTFPQAN